MSTPQVIIRPSSKRHGQFLTLLGVALVLILFIWNLVAPLPLAVLIVTLSAAIVLSVIGIAKVLEPDAALTVTPQFICYQHRKGQWQLAWDNILRFDQPRIQRFLDLQDMPYVGFRLHSYHDFLGQISQRMAVHLMLEQRNLLVVALRYEKPNERDYAQYFDVPLKYKSNEGHVYEGVKAAFCWRMEQLRELLGYDLYISENAFDRPADEFVQLLRQLRATRNNHIENKPTSEGTDPPTH
ncbi:DUF2982 domain-containing protein [Aliidiomarina haloalkalitolerans]|uniref:DUF2982 domain-containing protein n=1 Tax=Aliidiomarina haloalkalitolerans TaxID=859059 RepID=A0A432VTF1_9GAMM|nr:DUF2982 domain-containing protein [Aliidiomarina haloalkalitolerans]RUO19563.1 DUF2982 domain-containing protein [Aliidiomarina haloalkalitolerans]